MTKKQRRRLRRTNLELVSEEQEKPPKRNYKKVEIKARNFTQRRLLANLRNPAQYITVATGPAGTGKTYVATLYAIQQLQEKKIRKIILTRPAVSVDEQHGFLPGDINEKMAPWTRPIFDIFEEYYSPDQISEMMKKGTIEIAPLAYMRGRSFKNSIILLDEAQNITPAQMKMILTRIGEGSSLIVTGDLEQHDRGYSKNGLLDFITKLRNSESSMIGKVNFTMDDVERHPVVEEVLRLYQNME